MKIIWKLAGLCGLVFAPAAEAVPQIAAILNAASYARPGLPNSGIAPGSLFVVFGTDLGPSEVQQASGFPLAATLGETSVRVTVGGTAVDAYLVYTSAVQVAAVLPSNTPTGIGLLAVTYRGHTSQSGAFRIERRAPGILTRNQSGTGLAFAQNFNSDTDEPPNGLTHAAHPGQIVTLWATGMGPIDGDDATPMRRALTLNLQVLVGGRAATIRYSGRAACCAGIDQIVLEIPAGTEGCAVPVVARVDDTVSNFATIAVASRGDVCTNVNGVSGSELERLQGGGAVSWASLMLRADLDCGDYYYCENAPPPPTYDESGYGYFARSGSAIFSSYFRLDVPSPGSCSVFPSRGPGGAVMPEGPVSLDAGLTLNISGPKGSQQLTATSPGQYFRQLSYLVTQLQYLGPGDYVIDNGAGGADVGPFRATLTIPPPFTSSLERSSGTVRIRWSGGDPSGYVLIQGAGAATAGGLNANFVCAERVAAGQFVIPPEVLLSLPPDPSGRDIAVAVSSPVTTIFRAPGLDIGQFSYFSFLN